MRPDDCGTPHVAIDHNRHNRPRQHHRPAKSINACSQNRNITHEVPPRLPTDLTIQLPCVSALRLRVTRGRPWGDRPTRTIQEYLVLVIRVCSRTARLPPESTPLSSFFQLLIRQSLSQNRVFPRGSPLFPLFQAIFSRSFPQEEFFLLPRCSLLLPSRPFHSLLHIPMSLLVPELFLSL